MCPVRSPALTRHTFRSLMSRLANAGFKRDVLQRVVLPDWWDGVCEKDPALLAEIEFRVARFLGVSVSVVRNPGIPLDSPTYAGARLRRVKTADPNRLAPAVHTALAVAAAVVRCLKERVPSPDLPPADGLLWRDMIQRSSTSVTLEDILSDLWSRGVPVVPLDLLPAPAFQGMASVVGGRPVILLGHKHDEPGRVAFFVSHEVGHIAAGDCAPDEPVVDESEEVADTAEMEVRAERFATRVLAGADDVPSVSGENYRELATNAWKEEQESGVDAVMILFNWARQSGDYGTATMALKALFRGTGARQMLRRHFEANVEYSSASESDQALLSCVLA